MKTRMKVVLASAVFVTCSSLTPIMAGAVDDNIPFTLHIKQYMQNSRVSEGRYQGATNVNNKWKVKMTYTNEGGPGDYTSFWLENYNGNNVSDVVTINVQDGTVYSPAKGEASQCTVYLTAENNRSNDVTYTVRGFWDEETGK